VLKAQHPEFELWTQGIHSRSGVSCADCHMPYAREGATKVSDHWVRSPLLNINRACQTCHRFSESELAQRVEVIQSRNHALLQRGGAAIVELIEGIVSAQSAGVAPEVLERARALQRKAQWRLDSPPRTAWASMRLRRPHASWRKPSTTRVRGSWLC
jgi:nitrite reductase (cytochrome c-552)